MSHVTSTGPLHKWVPTSSNFRAAALAPSVSPALSTGGGCSQRLYTGSVDTSSCFLEGPHNPMCIMVTSAFPWGDKHCGAAVVGLLHVITLEVKGRSPYLLILCDAQICTWNISKVVNQNTLRGSSMLQVTPWAKYWELHTLVCGGKMSRFLWEGLGYAGWRARAILSHQDMRPEVKDGNVRLELGFSLLLVGPSLEGDQGMPYGGRGLTSGILER